MTIATRPATTNDLCLCGVERWRHATSDAQLADIRQRTYHTEVPHHRFMDYQRPEPTESVGKVPDSPLFADFAEALRCTAHIADRGIRAMYIATDMRLRGYTFAKRGEHGRFEKAE